MKLEEYRQLVLAFTRADNHYAECVKRHDAANDRYREAYNLRREASEKLMEGRTQFEAALSKDEV